MLLLRSFVEAALRTLPGTDGGTLVVGGDGRYGNVRAIDVILRMAAAMRRITSMARTLP